MFDIEDETDQSWNKEHQAESVLTHLFVRLHDCRVLKPVLLFLLVPPKYSAPIVGNSILALHHHDPSLLLQFVTLNGKDNKLIITS